ncbi:hypothetical protein GCM10020000_51140 [Streptomyces olivoverticillatus]
MLRLVPTAAHAVGLHLDRDALTVTLVDLTGAAVATRTAPLAFGAGERAVLDAVTAEVAALLSQAGAAGAPGAVLGVGVAAPGPLDHTAGVLHRVTGFPQWDGFPLCEALGARLGLPVVLDKDTNAAALGLVLRGGAFRGGSFAYLHLGTGLGAGLVLGGAVHRGGQDGGGRVRASGAPARRPAVPLRRPRLPGGAVPGRGRRRGHRAGRAPARHRRRQPRTAAGHRSRAARRADRPRRPPSRTPRGCGPCSPVPRRWPSHPAAGGTVVEGAAELVLAPLFGRAGFITCPDQPTGTTIGSSGGI